MPHERMTTTPRSPAYAVRLAILDFLSKGRASSRSVSTLYVHSDEGERIPNPHRQQTWARVTLNALRRAGFTTSVVTNWPPNTGGRGSHVEWSLTELGQVELQRLRDRG